MTTTGTHQPVIETERAGAELSEGLDALELGPAEPHTPWWRKALESGLPAVFGLGFMLLVWYAVVEVRDPENLPSPGEVFTSLRENWQEGRIQEAVLTSLERGGLGFLLSVAVGTPIGLVLSRVRLLRAAFGPIITGLQSMPSVAWVPAAILWFSLSEGTIYFVILLGAIPSIVNGTISGIDQVPPLFTRVGHVLGVLPGPVRPAAGRTARLHRRPQAGLGVLLALAHGGRAHRDELDLRAGPRPAARPVPPAVRHPGRPRRHHRDPRGGPRGRPARVQPGRARGAAAPRPAGHEVLTAGPGLRAGSVPA